MAATEPTTPTTPPDLGKLGEQIQTTSEELTTLIKQRDSEIKKNGEATEKTALKLDATGERLEAMATDAKTAGEAMDAQKKRVDEMEKKFNRPGFNNMEIEQAKSPGQAFVSSDAYKGMLKSGKFISDRVQVKSFFAKDAAPPGVVTTDAGSAGALIVPMRVPEIIIPPQRAMRMRDLITVANTTSPTVEYTEETGFAPLWTETTADAVAGDTAIVVDTISGISATQTIKIGTEVHTVASVVAGTNTVNIDPIYGLAADWPAGTEVVANDVNPTAEGLIKPQMNVKYELKTVSTKTIAAWIPISKQALADAGQLESAINTRLLYTLALSEERQILYGTGAGQDLQGILTNAGIQTYLWSAGTVGDTEIDAIRRAMTLARLAEYPTSGVVLHPTNWENIELQKGTTGRYIWVQVTEGGVMRIWKMPVVDTTAIAVGTFLTGAMKLGATLYDQQLASIDVAEQHEDFFTRNMVALRAEERVALANFRPEAFVAGTFDHAPVAGP